MQKIFLILIINLLFFSQSRGQRVVTGIKWGTTYTKLTPQQSDWVSEGFQWSYTAGFYFHSRRPNSNHFIQPEVLVSKKNGLLRYTGESKMVQKRYSLVPQQLVKRSFYYADVSLVIGYYILGNRLKLYAAPMFSYLLNARQKGEGVADAWFGQAAAGVVINYLVGVGVDAGRFGFDLRCEQNFSSVGEILPNGHQVNDAITSMQFTISYQLSRDYRQYSYYPER